MPINFPDNPTVGQQFTFGNNVWEWSGETWDIVPAAAVTIQVGTVTVGTPAAVTNVGTINNAILDFVIPTGPTGPQGPTGPAAPIFERKYATSGDYAYCGTAPQNSLESQSVWKIVRLTVSSSGTVTATLCASNVAWTNYLTATYSACP